MDGELLAFIIGIGLVFLTGPVFVTLLALFFFITYPKDANDDIVISDTRKDPVIGKASDKDIKPNRRKRL